MANKKFSEFTVKTDPANVDFLVGYDGTDNVRIDPSNLGGGGASDLNGLSDVVVDLSSDNAFLINTSPYANLTSGTKNLIIGEGAGNALRNSASGNICVGYNAGSINQLGSGGVAIGSSSATTSGGIKNGFVAIGDNSGASDYGVCLGYYANGLAAGGSGIVAISFQAARFNTANYHISIGQQAGYSNTSGSGNTNIGYQAGYANTTNGSRTIIGYEAGRFNVGNANTFVGENAGRSVSGSGFGQYNVSIGRESAYALTFGNFNVTIGAASAYSLANGNDNTIIGYEAGDNITSGSNNIVIGKGSDASSATVSNEITLGNSSISTLRCAVTSITSLSDERDKTEIKDLGYGLAFIDALQPREFVWNNRAETNKDGEEFYSSNKGKKDFGFIAQEVKELDNDTLRLVYDENPDKLELSYGKLVPILVQAIKELKEEVELLKS